MIHCLCKFTCVWSLLDKSYCNVTICKLDRKAYGDTASMRSWRLCESNTRGAAVLIPILYTVYLISHTLSPYILYRYAVLVPCVSASPHMHIHNLFPLCRMTLLNHSRHRRFTVLRTSILKINPFGSFEEMPISRGDRLTSLERAILINISTQPPKTDITRRYNNNDG